MTRRLAIGTVVIGASGFIALSYELLWYRLASFAASSTLAAFPLLLGSYLVGIALGSLGAERIVAAGRDTLRATSFALFAGAVIGALVGVLFGELLVIGVGYYASLLVFVFGALSLGFLFPLLGQWAVPADENVGAGVSYLYASNIVGSVLGTIVTGFVLLDHLTLAEMTALLSTLGALLFLVVSLAGDAPRRGRSIALTAVLIAASWLVVPTMYDGIWGKLFYWEAAPSRPAFAEVYEGRAGVVVVTEDGRALSGGVYEGTFAIDLVHDKNGLLRAFAGPMIHPDPKRVLVIGVATGSWATVLANAPGVEELVLVEIEHLWPRVIGDRDPQRGLFDDDRITWVFDDARRWLSANPDEKFDLIVMNSTYHWRSHTSMLLSRRFQEIALSHLNDDGIYMFNATDSANVWATVLDVFPNVLRVYNAGFASPSPITVDPDRWQRMLTQWSIYGRPVFDTTQPEQQQALDRIIELAARRGRGGPDDQMESDASLRQRFSHWSHITDDNILGEHRYKVVPRSVWLGDGNARDNRWEE